MNILKALVAVILLELLSLLILSVSERPKLSYLAQYQAQKSRNLELWQFSRVLHPYFGHVFGSGLRSNNMGFLDPHRFPIQRSSDQVIVGLFGDCESASLGLDGKFVETLERAIREARPEYANKKITLVNFGLAGGKQPQQYFVFSYFLEIMDIAINIDGFNELYIEPHPLFPVDFPQYAQMYYQVTTTHFAAKVLELAAIRKLMVFFTEVPLTLRPLASSQFYYLVWSDLKKVETSAERSARKNLLEEPMPIESMRNAENDDSLLLEKVETWKKYTKKQAVLATAYKIPSFYFLQPNPYYEGSKPLSSEEKGHLITPFPKQLNTGYKLLEQGVEDLRRSGVRAYSAAMIYRGIKDTEYMDGAGHLNSEGARILERFVVSKVREGLSKR